MENLYNGDVSAPTRILKEKMKFKISQEEFSKLLVSVNKSLQTKANLPILTNILISASKGKIEVLSTDLETATRVNTECNVEVEGKTTVPGRPISEFVAQVPPGEMIVEKLGEEVKVSSKRFSARFATMPIEDFPAIPKIDKGKTLVLDALEFSKAILRVAFSASQDEGRPALVGVLCEFSKKSFSMVATDGYRLSFQQFSAEGDFVGKIITPARTLFEVFKIISEAGEEASGKPVLVTVADALNQVNFGIGNVEFTSRLIEGEFPPWQKIIPTSFSSKAKISREELIRLVRVASIFARDSGNIIKLKLEGGAKGILTVSANNNQVGSDEASSEIELTGNGGEIAFNFRYLLEVLSSIESDDIFFEMIESLNPGRITIPDEGDYFHIVMPVRLQS
ncbi:DNA polymerase III subunit beta [Candidatus Curtissbacteria bacterium RIFCSPHIGHO2_01_FULL_41_11]|uniref:Beta sliding clamp n=1 Tax=Candidatus Curtissbacteria bacterium RIFCSPHIGHO2_01_FULL_41_11 TaxID=1797711 RepID=A0A1F5G6M2_9BACT|nr:MAG: DNA polymerase III subunit beta [Candidatus Curtissbacteria bacterium RIFCSPHIGHO2_01_FULL_41_11]